MKKLPWISVGLLMAAMVLYAGFMAFYHLVEPRIDFLYPDWMFTVTDLARQYMFAFISGLVLAGFACFATFIIKLLSSKEDS